MNLNSSLTGLISRIRSYDGNLQEYLNTVLSDIRQELKGDLRSKTDAIAKLTYLQMYGYDMDWAAFDVLEVAASSSFSNKRLGYFGMSTSYNVGTDALIMTPSQFKKDFTNPSLKNHSVALSSLAIIANDSVASYLLEDIIAQVRSAPVPIRRKAILTLYRLLLQYPTGLSTAFPAIQEALEHEDCSVVMCAVNVIAELVQYSPANYISTVPTLYRLLTDPSNHEKPHMLIKILKIFKYMLSVEPRLKKKLVSPLMELFSAPLPPKVILEAVSVVVVGITSSRTLLQESLSQLQKYLEGDGVEENDHANLQVICLDILGELVQVKRSAVSPHRELVLECLRSDDMLLRMKALKIMSNLVSKKNCKDIVMRFVDLLDVDANSGSADLRSSFTTTLVATIIRILTEENYANVDDFSWFIEIIFHLCTLECFIPFDLLADTLITTSLRIPSLRNAIVMICLDILDFYIARPGRGEELVKVASFIIGEYATVDSEIISFDQVFKSLCKTIEKMLIFSPLVQATLVQAWFKLHVRRPVFERSDAFHLLKNYAQSTDNEVQDRVCAVLQLIPMADQLSGLFEPSLKPVKASAQLKVKVPDDLDLDSFITEEGEALSYEALPHECVVSLSKEEPTRRKPRHDLPDWEDDEADKKAHKKKHRRRKHHSSKHSEVEDAPAEVTKSIEKPEKEPVVKEAPKKKVKAKVALHQSERLKGLSMKMNVTEPMVLDVEEEENDEAIDETIPVEKKGKLTLGDVVLNDEDLIDFNQQKYASGKVQGQLSTSKTEEKVKVKSSSGKKKKSGKKRHKKPKDEA
eukprot:TRINITY_DN3149_c2_g1_i1.p1 TRINITY_DN3149_c2_g1~~TRINITY_DN3149_c2_g1_i1.p1  ORF type:complete len:806 (+),score=111.62 TRINITY_DN3149_c2_g1_i1:27-2444(+)